MVYGIPRKDMAGKYKLVLGAHTVLNYVLQFIVHAPNELLRAHAMVSLLRFLAMVNYRSWSFQGLRNCEHIHFATLTNRCC